jgi:hypothetical protein
MGTRIIYSRDRQTQNNRGTRRLEMQELVDWKAIMSSFSSIYRGSLGEFVYQHSYNQRLILWKDSGQNFWNNLSNVSSLVRLSLRAER